jgi:multicomponent Na+:H+ antiporter subunit G
MWFDWIIFALVAFFVLSSLFMIFCGILGVYRMKYVLNRMNAAALIDTLALLFMNIGLIIANGFTFTSLKLFLIVLVMWLTSPISGHLISKLEYVTNKKIEEEIIVDEEEKVEC